MPMLRAFAICHSPLSNCLYWPLPANQSGQCRKFRLGPPFALLPLSCAHRPAAERPSCNSLTVAHQMLSDLVRLHLRHSNCTFTSVLEPPRATGMIWSN